MLERRCRALREIAVLLDEMQIKIRYRSPRMTELIEETAAESAFADNAFIRRVCMAMREGSPINEAWSFAAKTSPFLTETDRDILTDIASGLGGSDTEGQLSLLSLGGTMIDRALEQAENDRSGRSRMLMSVWTLCGIGAGIIIL